MPQVSSAVAATMSKGPMAVARERNNLSMGRAIVSGTPTMVRANIEAAKALKDFIVTNQIPVDMSQLSFDP